MKRSPELRDLSEQHHYGLVAARTLRLAAEHSRDVSGAVDAFLHAWDTEIQPHFQSEEAVLLPEFARIVGDDAPLVVRTLVEHVRLRRLVSELKRSAAQAPELAAQVARELHDHIRFEERILFPAIEADCAGEVLTGMGQALSSPVGRQCVISGVPESGERGQP